MRNERFDSARQKTSSFGDRSESPALNLTPGPVRIDRAVHEAFRRSPTSHRNPRFLDTIDELRERLCDLVNARHATLMLGSGTLANDAVAAQLGRKKEPGLVLVNGEFGRRLADAARRARLPIETIEAPWGAPLPYEAVRRQLAETPTASRPRWLWTTHCETSTGVLNDLDRLKELSASFGLRLCLDTISSIGTLDVDLDGVRLASCASGKGLCAYAGIATVFHDQSIESDTSLPRYLDLGLYAGSNGVPFTTSTNLVAAFSASPLLTIDRDTRAARHRGRMEAGQALRRRLEEAQWRIMAPAGISSPAVLTLVLDASLPSSAFGEALERRGLITSYRSGYLIERNLVQLCLMADHEASELDIVPGLLDQARRDVEAELVAAAQSIRTARSVLADDGADGH